MTEFVKVHFQEIEKIRLDTAAAKAKLSPVDFCHQTIMGALGELPRMVRDMTPEERALCDHPRDRWNRFQWGTVCGVCDQKIH